VVLKLEDKKAIVDEVAKIATSSISAIAADYRGLTVAEMTDLRAKARKTGVTLKVVRNTLAKRALEDTEFKCLSDVLNGPVFLAFSQDDPGAAARLIRDAAETLEKLKVRAIAIGGSLLDASSLKAVASLPTRNQAIAMVMAVLQAPVTGLARTLSETYAKFVRTVAAVRDQKQAAG
jgi:large subunit ribosomal protein L10